jgi:hypothetical protein
VMSPFPAPNCPQSRSTKTPAFVAGAQSVPIAKGVPGRWVLVAGQWVWMLCPSGSSVPAQEEPEPEPGPESAWDPALTGQGAMDILIHAN